jgi:predicted MFS family arabinose efflux permease
MRAMTTELPVTDEASPRYAGWRVVGACFLAALFCWGFGLYSHGVYLTELNRMYGWPTASISAGVTGFYLVTASLVVFVGDAIAKLGPKRVMLTGACCFGGAVIGLASINELWQLYLVYLVMAVGSATMHVGAISTVVGLWFDRKRPLAISLALNGASSGGILVTPVLVLAIARYGFSDAMLGAAAILAVVLLPAVVFWIGRPDAIPARPGDATAVSTWTRTSALRSTKFWSVAAPCALALTAQVGFLVHQIAALEPIMGRAQAAFSVAALTIAAICGRFGLGAFASRLDMRRFAACSMASQAAALLAMAATSNSVALVAACVVFGLSAGNLLTLPALIIQREFAAASFGVLIALSWAISQFTYAFGPGLLGIVRDATGNYTAPLMICAALDIAAASLILLRPRRP